MLKFLYSRPLPKELARDRLKFIIINDRDGITPYVLDIIKNEILTIIVKYVNIDVNSVSINLYNGGEFDVKGKSSRLVLTVPFYQNCNK